MFCYVDRYFVILFCLLHFLFQRDLYAVWREVQTTDTVGVASGLGETFIQKKYKNNVSKGVKVSKIHRGSGVLVVLRGIVKEGSVREGRV